MIEGVGFLHGFSTRWVRDALLRAVAPAIGPEEGMRPWNGWRPMFPPDRTE